MIPNPRVPGTAAFRGRMIFESDEEEVARLRLAPEGSRSHALAGLPVTLRHHPVRPVELPHDATGEHRGLNHDRIVVVPLDHCPASGTGSFPRPRAGSWRCRVVGGDSDVYTPGTSIVVSDAEIRRSAEVVL